MPQQDRQAGPVSPRRELPEYASTDIDYCTVKAINAYNVMFQFIKANGVLKNDDQLRWKGAF